MNNKDIERLLKLYLKGVITYEELKELLDKKDLKEPPTIY